MAQKDWWGCQYPSWVSLTSQGKSLGSHGKSGLETCEWGGEGKTPRYTVHAVSAKV